MKYFLLLFISIRVFSLSFDNCEGGNVLNQLDAEKYCFAKGMRLPFLKETVAGGGIVPSCENVTWTNTPDGIQNEFRDFKYKTFLNEFEGSSPFSAKDIFVRCVKD